MGSGAERLSAFFSALVSGGVCGKQYSSFLFLRQEPPAGHTALPSDAELQRRAMEVAAECGMVDMYGWTIPAIDGFGRELCASIVTSMRECVKYSLALEKKCKTWFDRVLEKGYFQK